MEEYKQKFIEFLLSTGALRVGPDFSLKSGRISPWFVNMGDFNDGASSAALGEFYADALISSGTGFGLLYGIPEKGNAIAVATAIGLFEKGVNVPWFFTRKVPKEYGEATNLTQADRIKALVVGRAPMEWQSIAQLDDVFTAGDAKYEARQVLQSLGKFDFPLLAIALDRQEVAVNGKSAITEYEQNTGTKVIAIVNAMEVYNYLRDQSQERLPEINRLISETVSKIGSIESEISEVSKEFKTSPGETHLRELTEKRAAISTLKQYMQVLENTECALEPGNLDRMATYLRVYGTPEVRGSFGKLEQIIINRDKSVIPDCNVPFERFEDLIIQTADIDGVGAYKIDAIAGRKGWEQWVEVARKHTDKPLIYDHQKAGTDIPDTAKEFMKELKASGFDAVILFPQSGPETERAWIYHALDKGLKVIVGGRMTHPAYSVSEGGFITDEGAMEMYRIAARAGINNFVVPGNKPEVISQIKKLVEAEGIKPIFYAPGFVAQGGKFGDAAKVAGDYWHAIVGRGIYQAPDMRAAAIEHTSQL